MAHEHVSAFGTCQAGNRPTDTSVPQGSAYASWNETAADYPDDRCVHQLFEEQVERTPESSALSFGRDAISFRDLNKRANRLAHYLRACGVARETLVAIAMERSIDMVVSVLGILKAGGAYIPIDPGYPRSYQEFMLSDSGANLVLTRYGAMPNLPPTATPIFVDTDRDCMEQHSDVNPSSVTMPDDMAYVIYTSGSTGRSKGVVGIHRGAVNRFAWMWDVYPFAAGEVCCQKTSLNFVDSVAEIFVPMLQGVPTVIVPDGVVKDPAALVSLLSAEHVTRIVLVPSLLRAILNLPADLLGQVTALRFWCSSGEVLAPDLVLRFRERLGDAVLVNIYGSTEVSADVTCFDTRSWRTDRETVPIGRPIANSRIHILDGQNEPVAVGEVGEIHVGGVGLARGYWNQPELTAERFVPAMFGAYEDRLFKTGDLGRYLPDGNIEYVGRMDHQVKIRGYRVELQQIERVLLLHPAVREAVMVARPNSATDGRLIAYVVAQEETSITPTILRRFCQDRLPDFMVPAAFVLLDAMPLTPNGKVNRRALPTVESAGAGFVDKAILEPCTRKDDQLAKIWRDVLGIERIDVNESFFDLGGDSLLAVRLCLQIENELGRRVPISALAEQFTIADMARALEQEDAGRKWSPLVALQPQGTSPPLFLVHGIGGEVLNLTGLAGHFAPDRPVYGIRVQRIEAREEPIITVERRAEDYIHAMRQVTPVGPYYLGGFSAGGVIALEMAQQLREQGEEVALLVIIDGEAPGAATGASRLTLQAIRAQLRNLATWVNDHDVSSTPPRELIRWLSSQLRLARAKLLALLPSYAAQRPDLRGELLGVWFFPEEHRDFVLRLCESLAKYQARPYPGPITLIRARSQTLWTYVEHDLGWNAIAQGGLDIRVVRGSHGNILTQPRVREMAAHLSASIEAAARRMIAAACQRQP
jgi:amino acid adenylation domain-containing protein